MEGRAGHLNASKGVAKGFPGERLVSGSEDKTVRAFQAAQVDKHVLEMQSRKDITEAISDNAPAKRHGYALGNEDKTVRAFQAAQVDKHVLEMQSRKDITEAISDNAPAKRHGYALGNRGSVQTPARAPELTDGRPALVAMSQPRFMRDQVQSDAASTAQAATESEVCAEQAAVLSYREPGILLTENPGSLLVVQPEVLVCRESVDENQEPIFDVNMDIEGGTPSSSRTKPIVQASPFVVGKVMNRFDEAMLGSRIETLDPDGVVSVKDFVEAKEVDQKKLNKSLHDAEMYFKEMTDQEISIHNSKTPIRNFKNRKRNSKMKSKQLRTENETLRANNAALESRCAELTLENTTKEDLLKEAKKLHAIDAINLQKAKEEKRVTESLLKEAQEKLDGQAKADPIDDGEKRRLESDLELVVNDNRELTDEISSLKEKLASLQLELVTYKERVKDQLAKDLSDQYKKEFEAEVIREKSEKEDVTARFKLLAERMEVMQKENDAQIREILTLRRESVEVSERILRMERGGASALNLSNTGNSENQSHDRSGYDQQEIYRQALEEKGRKVEELTQILFIMNGENMVKVKENRELTSKISSIHRERDEAKIDAKRTKDRLASKKSIQEKLINQFRNFNKFGNLNLIKKCFQAFKKCFENFKRKADLEHRLEHFKKQFAVKRIKNWHKKCHVPRSKAAKCYWRTVESKERLLVRKCFFSFYRAQFIQDEEVKALLEDSTGKWSSALWFKVKKLDA